jgi:DNA-binding beta-propeller fold protein YncE
MNASPSTRALLVALGLSMIPAVAAAQSFTVTKHDIGGDGRFDYLNAEPATGRVFVSRGTHVMVVDGPSGKVLGDIQNTPGVHGIAFAPKHSHGFITSSGDSTVTMFDLASLDVIQRIATHTGGLDGIMYDDGSDRIVLTNHSRPIGTATAIDAGSGAIVGVAQLESTSPEGAASDGKGKLFVNNEGSSTLQELDAQSMTVLASWPLAPCEGPTGIAYDRANDLVFSGCSNTSVVTDPKTGKVVAQIQNGAGVDALGWDPAEKLIYIPAGSSGNVTVVHQDGPTSYKVVATVNTMRGARTLTVDTARHVAYTFTPEYGPAPAAPSGAPPARGRGNFGPQVAAWLFTISH